MAKFRLNSIGRINKYFATCFDQILKITKEVSKFAFPEHGVPTADTVLTGFKDIISDNLFNAAGSITARKIAHKARTTFSKQTDYSKKATLQQLNS